MIQITDEMGDVLKEIPINVGEIIMGGLYRTDNYKINYPLLSGVDLYGDTVFNIQQVGPLLEELKKLEKKLSDHNVTKSPLVTNYPDKVNENTVLNSLRELIEFTNLDTHEYIKFIGD